MCISTFSNIFAKSTVPLEISFAVPNNVIIPVLKSPSVTDGSIEATVSFNPPGVPQEPTSSPKISKQSLPTPAWGLSLKDIACTSDIKPFSISTPSS